jgi:hypothetical protein
LLLQDNNSPFRILFHDNAFLVVLLLKI